MAWWKVHLDAVRETFGGKLYTQYHTDEQLVYAKENGLTALKGADNKGLGRSIIHFNSNSGAQAINLAYFEGATRIILLGFDMQNTGGKAHWFGEHPEGLHTGEYHHFVPSFDRLAKDLAGEGVEVINCSRQTALTQFKRATLDDTDLYSIQ